MLETMFGASDYEDDGDAGERLLLFPHHTHDTLDDGGDRNGSSDRRVGREFTL